MHTVAFSRHTIGRILGRAMTPVLLVATLAARAVAVECTAADVMAAEGSSTCPSAGACTITHTHVIGASCTLDFSNRDVVIGQTGRLTGGSLTLRAATLTIKANTLGAGRIDGTDVDIDLEVAGFVWLQHYNGAWGTIQVTTNTTGSVTINAGSVNVLGTVRTLPGGASASGGTVTITTAGDLVVGAGAFLGAAGGANGGAGGTLTLIAGGSVTVVPAANVSGGTGGTLSASASGAVTLGEIDAQALDAADGGDGGAVAIYAGTSVSLTGPIYLSGAGSSTGSGDGGTMDLTAGNGAVMLNGTITGSGAGGGSGQYVNVVAPQGNVTLSASITLNGTGDGDGGAILVEADSGSVTIGGALTANGSGAGGGGTIEVDVSGGDLTVNNALTANAPSNGDEESGLITLSADGSVTVQSGATLAVRAAATTGGGGEIDMSAGVDLQTNALLDVSGGDEGGGSVYLTAGRTVTLNAKIDASGRGYGDPGGYVSVSAGLGDQTGILTANQIIDVSGGACSTGSGCGSGGFAMLTACTVTIAASTGEVLATGESGGIQLTGRQHIAVNGTLNATKYSTGTTNGSIDTYIVNTSNGGSYAQGGSAAVTPTRTAHQLAPCLFNGQSDCLWPCASCAGMAAGTVCTDAVFCNGADTCTSGGTCGTHAGNPCTGGAECNDTCNEDTVSCLVAAGTACTDDGNVCTTDTCDGNGACAHEAGNAGTTCRASAGDCDLPETCNGADTACPPDSVETSGTACTDDGNVCTTDLCDGTHVTCQHTAGNAATICRASAGECDVAETCTGTSAACPADSLKASGTACTDDGNVCTTDVCAGTNATCQHAAGNAGTICRAAAGACDVAEACTGTSTTCPADSLVASGTTCRVAAGECDLAETCTGNSATCPTDMKKAGGTGCTDDGNPCTADRCDGNSVACQHPPADAGVCRAATSACDVAELWTCTGSTATCPADSFVASGTICRAPAGECDVAEACTGSSATCPSDTVKANGTTCADDGNACTTDLCDGTNVSCQHAAGNAGTTCRAAAGACDVAETCTGTSSTCPTDLLVPSSTVCRTVAGACDVAESCTGTSATCPADGFVTRGTLCRDATGECDAVESCTGSSAVCPADSVRDNGTACADDGNPCTTDLCDGTSTSCQHAPGNADTICRDAAGPCDVIEVCTGASGDCPDDGFLPGGIVCRDAVDECDAVESCTGTSATCPTDRVFSSGTACTDDGNVCTTDLCDGTNVSCQHATGNAGTACRAAVSVCERGAVCTGTSSDCPANVLADAGTECRAAVDECDVAETCTGSSNACPIDGFAATGTACTADDDTCTLDQCDGAGSCTHPRDPVLDECVLPLTLVRTIPAPSTIDALFGWSVGSLGPVLLAGAPGRMTDGHAHGIVYAFDPGTGNLVQTLRNPSTAAEDDYFGIALVGPNAVVVGALPTVGDQSSAGSVYGFNLQDASLAATTQPSSPATNGQFGAGLAVATTSDVLVTEPGSGAGYRVNSNSVVATFTNPFSEPLANPSAVTSATTAGRAMVAIGNYASGNYLNVFAEDSGDLVRTVYQPTSDGGAFGYALATVGANIVATRWSADAGGGAAYLVDPTTGDVAQTLSNPDPNTGFGFATAAVGGRVAVTGLSFADGGQVDHSVVYLFNPATGNLVQTLTNPSAGITGFGTALTAMGNSLLVGAADRAAGQAGAVYVYAPCGDGNLDPGEQCDDGNLTDGDGCSSTCQVELGAGCELASLEAVDDQQVWGISQQNPPDQFGCVDPATLGLNILWSFYGPFLFWNPLAVHSTSLLRWDTSSLPSGTTVNRAWLRLYLGFVGNANDKVLAGDWFDWGTTCVDTDSAPDTATNALSTSGACGTNCALSTIAAATGASGVGFQSFALDNAGDHVDPTGSTHLRVHIPDQDVTGANEITFDGSFSSRLGPRLLLEVCGSSGTPTPTPVVGSCAMSDGCSAGTCVASQSEVGCVLASMGDNCSPLSWSPEVSDCSAPAASTGCCVVTGASAVTGSDPVCAGNADGSPFMRLTEAGCQAICGALEQAGAQSLPDCSTVWGYGQDCGDSPYTGCVPVDTPTPTRTPTPPPTP